MLHYYCVENIYFKINHESEKTGETLCPFRTHNNPTLALRLIRVTQTQLYLDLADWGLC